MSESGTRDATPAERDAARQLLAAAKYLKDAEDADAFAEVWAKGASLVIHSNGTEIGPFTGRAAIMEFYAGNWARAAHGAGAGRETHVCENPYIVGLADGQLRAIHSAMFAAMDGDIPVLIGFAEFRDVLTQEQGRWRILSRLSQIRRIKRPPA